MTVPEDCETIYVNQTVSNNVCNGAYELDSATQEWVNSANPTCKLTKVFDSQTGQYTWVFSVQVPEGSDPPPGSKCAATFKYYRNYSIVAGVYAEQKEGSGSAQWSALPGHEMDGNYGVGIEYPPSYAIDNSKALPSTVSIDGKQLKLAAKGAGLTTGFWSFSNVILDSSAIDDFKYSYQSQTGSPTVLFTENAYAVSIPNFSGLIDPPITAKMNLRLGYDVNGYSYDARYILGYHNSTGQDVTYFSNDIARDAYCAVPSMDTILTGTMTKNGARYFKDSGENGIYFGITRYGAVGNPITYIVRNPSEDEQGYDENDPNPRFPFYEHVISNQKIKAGFLMRGHQRYLAPLMHRELLQLRQKIIHPKCSASTKIGILKKLTFLNLITQTFQPLPILFKRDMFHLMVRFQKELFYLKLVKGLVTGIDI